MRVSAPEGRADGRHRAASSWLQGGDKAPGPGGGRACTPLAALPAAGPRGRLIKQHSVRRARRATPGGERSVRTTERTTVLGATSIARRQSARPRARCCLSFSRLDQRVKEPLPETGRHGQCHVCPARPLRRSSVYTLYLQSRAGSPAGAGLHSSSERRRGPRCCTPRGGLSTGI